jgi:hypothetical protein
MSKSNPTLRNVPYYYGICKFFLKVFLEGPDRGGKSRLREVEVLPGKEVLIRGFEGRNSKKHQ